MGIACLFCFFERIEMWFIVLGTVIEILKSLSLPVSPEPTANALQLCVSVCLSVTHIAAFQILQTSCRSTMHLLLELASFPWLLPSTCKRPHFAFTRFASSTTASNHNHHSMHSFTIFTRTALHIVSERPIWLGTALALKQTSRQRLKSVKTAFSSTTP